MIAEIAVTIAINIMIIVVTAAAAARFVTVIASGNRKIHC